MTLISTDIDLPLGVSEDLYIDYSHEYEEPYSFRYNLNSRGMRTGEFNKEYNLVVAGCSLTYGIGIPEEGRWGDILSNMIDEDVANLSYSGRCTEFIIFNLIKFISKNKPKYIICLFPNFERLTYVEYSTVSATNLGYEKMILTKADSIVASLPQELAWKKALDSISMLENICKSMDIKFLWSTWSISNLENEKRFKDFSCYVHDITRLDFPPYLQWNSWTVDKQERKNLFIFPDTKCHLEHELSNSIYYNYGGDSAMRIEGDRQGFCPHPGIHRNIHWADFFYKEMKSRGWLNDSSRN